MKIVTKLLSFGLALVLALTTLMPSPAMADPSLNQEQQVFILSYLSNGVAGMTCEQEELQALLTEQITSSLLSNGVADMTCEQKLQALLTEQVTSALADEIIQGYIGDWDVVWGPVVYIDPSSLIQSPTNTMYVAQKDNEYVVAIAGTQSLNNWLYQNFPGEEVTWPYGDYARSKLDPNIFDTCEPDGSIGPKISQGICRGLGNILRMKSSGKTLLQFLNEAVDSDPHIIFTGASLGGALSPTLALAVLDRQDEWADGNNFTISVYPFAGFTPGDRDFSTYYDQRLGTNTTRNWNVLDVVPHLWNEETIAQIPDLYLPEIEPSNLIRVLQYGLRFLARGGNYTQIPTSKELDGNVVIPAPQDICQGVPFQNLTSSVAPTLTVNSQASRSVELSKPGICEKYSQTCDFIQQLIYQHFLAYVELLDVVEPYCYLEKNIKGLEPLTILQPSEIEEFVLQLLKAELAELQ